MLYRFLSKVYEELEATSKRLEMTDTLVQLFKETPTDIIDKVIFLTQGKLHPGWLDEPVIGIAEKSAIKAVSNALEKNFVIIEAKLKEKGDLGSTFEKLHKKKKSIFLNPLTVKKVFNTLDKIAKSSGSQSSKLKIRYLTGLLRDGEAIEGKWILRTVLGKLRVGAADATILDALTIAFTGDKENKLIIERGYNIHPNLGEIAKILATDRLGSIKKIKINIFTPVKMMLAKSLSTIEEILEKFGGKACGCEFKYDGVRIQAHKSGIEVKLFSRNLENATSQFPDILSLIRKLHVDEIIVEGECVAIDPLTGDIRPFQELSHRRRKYSIEETMKNYPICLYLFDILKKDGQDLTNEPYLIRRKYLKEIVIEKNRLKLQHQW